MEYTAEDCRRAEKEFYQEAADRFNKIWEPWLEEILTEMLNIARKYMDDKPCVKVPITYSLSCCNKAPTPPSLNTLEAKTMATEKEKEEAMDTKSMKLYNETDVNVNVGETQLVQNERKFLAERLLTIRSEKRDLLRKKFNMDGMEAPKTPKELRERLLAGLFTIDGENTNEFPKYTMPRSAINWRDPAKPADEAGYTAAKEVLAKAMTTVREDIEILAPVDALASIRAFAAEAI